MTERSEQRMDAWLSEHVDAMAREVNKGLRARIPLYRDVADEQLQPAARAFVELFVTALRTGDAEPLLVAAARNVERRVAQGLTFEDGIHFTAPLRHAFFSVVGPAIERSVKDVFEFILRAERIFERLDRVSARFVWSELERARQSLSESEERHRKLVELSPDGVAVLRDGQFLFVNRTLAAMFGSAAPEELVGAKVAAFLDPSQREAAIGRFAVAERESTPLGRSEETWAIAGGDRITVELLGAPVVFKGEAALQIVFRDITERKRAEQALEQTKRQEERLFAQEQMLRDLSTPLIPVSDDVVVMPVVGALNEARARQMRGVLLDGITAHRARVAILDITGVPGVGAEVAEALLGAVRSARLLGAEVVLSGIKPAAAQAFVSIGADFTGIVTRGTLKDGIAYALSKA